MMKKRISSSSGGDTTAIESSTGAVPLNAISPDDDDDGEAALPLIASDFDAQLRLHHHHHHNDAAAVNNMDQRSILEMRERLGFCTTCPGAPTKLYEITTQTRYNNFRSKMPFNQKHESYQGICLTCHPQVNPDISQHRAATMHSSPHKRSTKRLGGAASRRRDQHQQRVSVILEQQQLMEQQQQQQQQQMHHINNNNSNIYNNQDIMAMHQLHAQQLRYPPINPAPAYHHDNRHYIFNSQQHHQRLMQQPEYGAPPPPPSIQYYDYHEQRQQIIEQHRGGEQLMHAHHPTVPQEVLLNKAGENDSMTSIGLGSINTPANYQPHPQQTTQYQYQPSPLPYGPFHEYPPPPSMKSYAMSRSAAQSSEDKANKKKKKKKKKSSSRKNKSSKNKESAKDEAEIFSDPDFPNEKKAADAAAASRQQQIENDIVSCFPSMHSLTESKAAKEWATDWGGQDDDDDNEEEEADDGDDDDEEEEFDVEKSKESFSELSGTTASCDKKPVAVDSPATTSRQQQGDVAVPENTAACVAVATTAAARNGELVAATTTSEGHGSQQQQQEEETQEQQRQRQIEDQRSLLEDVKAAAIESNKIEIFLDLLVTTLQEQQTSQTIVALCLRQVWDCAKHIDGCKTMIMECRLDVHIKHALEKYLDDEHVQHYGCRCVWSLSVDPECRQLLIQAGAIQWIYNTLEDYKDNKYVLESAFGAMRTMSSSYTTAVQASHQQQFSDSSYSQSSMSSPARVLLLPLDALRPSVCRIMGRHPSSIPLQRDGCAFLSNVAVDMDQQVVSVVSKDEITAVVQALAMYGAPDVWGCACFCLKNYTYEDRNLRMLLKLYDPFLLDLLQSIVTSIDQRQQLAIITNTSIRRQIREDANQIRQSLELFKAEEEEMEEITYSSLVDAIQGMFLDEAIGTILGDILNNPERQLSTKLICFGISKLRELSSITSDKGPDAAAGKNGTHDERSNDIERDNSTMSVKTSNFQCVVSNPLVWKAILNTMDEQIGNIEIQQAGCGAIQFWINEDSNTSKEQLIQFDAKYALDIVVAAANLHGDALIQETLKTMETVCLKGLAAGTAVVDNEGGEEGNVRSSTVSQTNS